MRTVLNTDHINLVNRKLVDWLRYASVQQGASMSSGGFFTGPRSRQVITREIPNQKNRDGSIGSKTKMGPACSVVVKLLDLDLQGHPWCGQDKICTAVGPLSKAVNPTLLQVVCLLLSIINCKSLWIKASANCNVM